MHSENQHNKSRPILRLIICMSALALVAGICIWTWEWREHVRLLGEVRYALSVGDFELAEQSLNTAFAELGTDAEVYYLKAILARRQGRLADADSFLRQAARLGWSSTDIELQRCLTIVQSGHINQVERRLDEIMQAGTTDDVAEQVYEATAKGYLVSYRLRDAWECLNSWLAWQPNNVKARLWRGHISEIIAKPSQAVEEYKEILTFQPNNAEVRQRLGACLLILSQVTEANEHFDWLLKQDQDNAQAMLGLAQCKRRMGDLDKALELSERVLASEPNEELRGKAQLEIGTTLLSQRKSEQALEYLQLAVNSFPNDQEVHYALSRVYGQLGQTDKVAECNERARELETTRVRIREILQDLVTNPDNAKLRLELARIMNAQGNANAAAHWLGIAGDFANSNSQRLLTEDVTLGDDE